MQISVAPIRVFRFRGGGQKTLMRVAYLICTHNFPVAKTVSLLNASKAEKAFFVNFRCFILDLKVVGVTAVVANKTFCPFAFRQHIS